MTKIGLVTSKDFPNLSHDDQLLYLHLMKSNYDVEPVVWNVHNDWDKFDILIVRSVWDYHLNQQRFQDWLEQLVSANLKVMNEVSLIRKNLHKSYLIKFLEEGLSVIPTKMVKKNDPETMGILVESFGDSDIIIKPAVSLNSYDTFLVRKEEIPNKKTFFETLLSRHDLLIQPFVSEVKENGELSLIFFNRNFSHAVRKLPAKKDFRVQTDFRGKVHLVHLSSDIINQASQYLTTLETTPSFARVDGVILEGKFYLMELELIDPSLFFGHSPESLNAFSCAIEELGYNM